MLSLLPYFKAFHIMGFVAWFAGLFYLARLFVYHVEAEKKAQPERDILTSQYHIMEWRLYHIITNPAMWLTFFFGVGMLVLQPVYLQFGWLHIKLFLLVLLVGYHHYCKHLIKKLKNGTNTFTSFQFRLFNELPTLFLVGIVLLAVLKSALNFLYALIGLIIFGFLLYIGAKFYKNIREK